jgi:hypothetical protein
LEAEIFREKISPSKNLPAITCSGADVQPVQDGAHGIGDGMTSGVPHRAMQSLNARSLSVAARPIQTHQLALSD